MDAGRRQLGRVLVWGPVAVLGACAGPARLPRPLVPYRLVDRLTWGASDADLARAAQRGAAGFRAAQLGGDGDVPAPVQSQIDALPGLQQPLLARLVELDAQKKALDASVGEAARQQALAAYQDALNRQARAAAARDLLRALYSTAQLREQMSWFWFNHFNVHQQKSTLRAMVGDFQQALRPLALGDFRAMLGVATRHPAMLRYLDNDQNTAQRGNENHARELLELHTLGVDGGYTQRDLQELARVLTGHGLNLGPPPRLRPEHEALYRREGVYEFHPGRHDFGTKTLFGQTLRSRGAQQLDEALDLIVAQPACARFISRRIAVFLAADEPDGADIEAMARAFGSGRIEAALAVLLDAPSFVDGPPKFKDPLRYVLSALRAAHGERVVRQTGPVQSWLNRMGQGLYNRSTPDGYPLVAEAWNGSGQLAVRFEVARAIGTGAASLFRPEGDTTAAVDPPALPALARSARYAQVRDGLREATRVALAGAASPQAWNTLYLAAPDFMVR